MLRGGVVYNNSNMNKDEAKQKVAELVKKYEALSPAEIKGYNEAATKASFIEPLFRALGWNFEDTNEVAPEEKASGGRVDYAFKLNSVSIFFLEAKPLKADLTNETYIKQAVTYAYNKGVTWAVLTDFETLIVYVAQTSKPFITLTCNKYIDAFDDLWLLSKESFLNNALGEKAERYGALPQRMGIEQRLFNQLRLWREELSTQLHSYEKKLTVKQIDEVIQRLFNRLIFIRTCEDRKIEEKVLLSTVHEWVRNKRKVELIEKLREIFRYFDGYYDSELFQKHLTDEIFIEGDTLERLINGLYEVQSGMASYDFSIIDADVLGAVYEQYLGHIANIVKEKAKKAQAKMDLGLPYDERIELTEKKQRRKEHGIYYTPKFITDYIVKETVGRFIAERSLKEIRNIKILDPACGSGSFLIRAFDELLKYYASQKISKSEQDIDAADRMSILQNNIYGVDLDIQAVEIARLNLLLRSLAKRETLPCLKDNIKEGNSLISGTEDDLKKYFGNNWKEKKAFNWEEEFKDIMDEGGFDVVIGNPPYIDSEAMTKTQPELREFCSRYYESAKGNWDIFSVFLERALSLLKNGGYLGMIVPNKLLSAKYCESIRKLIQNNEIIALRDYSSIPVFGSNVYPIIIIVKKTVPNHSSFLVEVIESDNGELNTTYSKQVRQDLLEKTPTWSPVLNESQSSIVSRISKKSLKLKDIAEIYGAATVSEAYEIKDFLKELRNEKGYFKFINTGTIDRYTSLWNISPTHYLKSKFTRPIVKRTDLKTFSLRRYEQSLQEKIIIGGMSKILECYLDDGEYLAGKSTIVVFTNNINLKALLAILNSKLLTYFYKSLFKSLSLSGGFMRVGTPQVGDLPIKIPSDIQQKEIGEYAIHLQILNEKLSPIRDTPFSESEALKKEIEKTNKEIDNLVYDLYGLTEEERKIVEGEV